MCECTASLRHWCADRLKKLHEEFYEHVDPAEVADILDVDLDTVDCLYTYWVFKRKVPSTGFITVTLMLYVKVFSSS